MHPVTDIVDPLCFLLSSCPMQAVAGRLQAVARRLLARKTRRTRGDGTGSLTLTAEHTGEREERERELFRCPLNGLCVLHTGRVYRVYPLRVSFSVAFSYPPQSFACLHMPVMFVYENLSLGTRTERERDSATLVLHMVAWMGPEEEKKKNGNQPHFPPIPVSNHPSTSTHPRFQKQLSE